MDEEGEGDPIEAAWTRLRERWTDDDAHRRFIALCASLGRLNEAGTRYRRVREDPRDAAEGEQARRQTERLLGVALQSLEAVRSAPPVRARRLLLLLAVIITAILVGTTLGAVLGPK